MKDQTPIGRPAEGQMHALLGYQVVQAAIATNAIYQQTVGDPQELRPVEYTLLTLIAENPAVPASRLARALAVTKPNITMWLDRLEARGFVKRRPSRSDGRAIELHATAAGAKLADSCTQALLASERRLFDHLSAAESAMLVELLHKVAQRRPEIKTGARPQPAPARAKR